MKDFTDQYNTQLDPAVEAQFQAWLNQAQKQRDLYDYDLRGAFKDGLLADPRGHLPDTYKKPNHPTFSNESVYHTPEMPGGMWQPQQNGSWLFQASPFNVQMHGAPGLIDYFQRVEPGNQVVLPYQEGP